METSALLSCLRDHLAQGTPEPVRAIAHRQISSAELTQILCRAGLPANYAAIVVRDQEAIREGLGTRVTDVVPRIAGRAAIPFSAYAAHAAPAFATR